MATNRKTIPVENLIKSANAFFRESDWDEVNERLAVARVLESVLIGVNYSGFRYLSSEEISNNESKDRPGYHIDENGEVVVDDSSRRHYFYIVDNQVII